MMMVLFNPAIPVKSHGCRTSLVTCCWSHVAYALRLSAALYATCMQSRACGVDAQVPAWFAESAVKHNVIESISKFLACAVQPGVSAPVEVVKEVRYHQRASPSPASIMARCSKYPHFVLGK